MNALAETRPWPTRPIELIVPWPAGGATDLTLRILAEEVEPTLGQPVVVVNKPGVAGTLVASELKSAKPDGYTIGQIPATVMRRWLMKDVPWDPLTDIEPIIQISGVTFGILVPASSQWQSLPDMIAWAKAHPGELILGSTGVGTTAHLAMEEILHANEVDFVHVPYKGTSDQMLAIASAQIMAGVNSNGFAPWVDQGKMRLLAVFTDTRIERWKDVPTVKELGYPKAVYTSPWGLGAPAGTPPAVIEKLHDAFRTAVQSKRHIEALARYDQSVNYLNAADYRAAIRDQMDREKRLLKRLGLLAEGK
ncbi:tripartite tricarboxylate transporter substrate binding protein [Hydrogenophaga sp. 5NK40-0174]|uniref:tripartite tricarboxylate transporter substrate binding protein n=1 Tax=Hydrogenophaga sp. 5NK40-0174 TaxID=3127649 RepID=UPI00334055A6